MIQIKSFTFNDFQENTYIISLNNQCVIIDPGNYYDNENVEIKKSGKLPDFNFKPKSHYELGEKLGMLDSNTKKTCKENPEIRDIKIKNIEHAINQAEMMIRESKMSQEELLKQ